MNMATLKLEIIKILMTAEHPLILNHIAKRSGRSVQLIDYHIKKLIEERVVHTFTEEDKIYYCLSSPFYDKNAITALYSLLTPYISETASEIKENNPEFDTIEVYNVFMYLLQLFIADLKGFLAKQTISKNLSVK